MAQFSINMIPALKNEFDSNELLLYILQDYLTIAVVVLGPAHPLVSSLINRIVQIEGRNEVIRNIIDTVDTGIHSLY